MNRYIFSNWSNYWTLLTIGVITPIYMVKQTFISEQI